MSNPVERYLLVILGGGIGAALRYLASEVFGARPLTTFAVNISGSFCIGLFAASTLGEDVRWRLLLAAGLLGGYTTFSSLQLEAFLTLRVGQLGGAFTNLIGSIIAGLAAVSVGFWMASRTLR